MDYGLWTVDSYLWGCGVMLDHEVRVDQRSVASKAFASLETAEGGGTRKEAIGKVAKGRSFSQGKCREERETIAQTIERIKVHYFILGLFSGFLGGSTNFFPMYGIPIYPYGNFTVTLYCLIVTYAILRYRLLDISLAVTRSGIFIVVYTLVLGTPFSMTLAYQDQMIKILGNYWWTIPLVSSTFLASVGPYVYGFIQRKAEENLLQGPRYAPQTVPVQHALHYCRINRQ